MALPPPCGHWLGSQTNILLILPTTKKKEGSRVFLGFCLKSNGMPYSMERVIFLNPKCCYEGCLVSLLLIFKWNALHVRFNLKKGQVDPWLALNTRDRDGEQAQHCIHMYHIHITWLVEAQLTFKAVRHCWVCFCYGVWGCKGDFYAPS